VIVLPAVAVLVLFVSGCGSGQSVQPTQTGTSFWLSRAGEPATDATILSVDEPLVQSDGHIDLPAGEIANSGDIAKPKHQHPGRSKSSRRTTDIQDGAVTHGTANKWQPIEPWLVNLLVGRDLQRGERAFIRATDVKFYAPTPTDKLHVPVTP